MSAETRDTLLHGQLQEGLRQEIMRAPAVSGAQSYRKLCLAARNEEKRPAELRKRQQYQRASSSSSSPRTNRPTESKMVAANKPRTQEGHQCYNCRQTGHLVCECTKRTESSGQKDQRTTTKQVVVGRGSTTETGQSMILDDFRASALIRRGA